MTESTSTPASRLSLVAALAVTTALAGTACMDVGSRSQARAEISGPDGTAVQVVTSTQFVQEQNASGAFQPDTGGTSVNLITADTARRSLPTTVDQSLTETQRFYVEVALTDSAETEATEPVDAEMQLLVDGEQKARVQNDLLERALRIAFRSFVSG